MALPRPLDLLACDISSARQIVSRVSRGSITSSIRSLPAAHVHVEDLAEALDQLCLLRRRVLCRVDLFAERDLDHALRAHHADLRARPRHDQVRLIRAAVHHVVAGAVGLARDHRDLRHRRVGDRVEHLGAVADDAFGLDLRADHEAGHVLDEHQRDRERVAQVHEARGLVGGVVVEDAAQLLGLVGDDPDRPSAEAREARDDRLRPLALDVEVLAVVDDPADHLVHVIRLAVGVRQHVQQLLLAAVDRVGARAGSGQALRSSGACRRGIA